MSTHKIIQKSIQYMENHLQEEITLEEIAAHAGFSPFHFHRLFRKEVGINVADYLRTRRLCYASRLLLYSDESIINISLSCHFESQEAFTRAFKKMYGMPPGRYRKVITPHTFATLGGDHMKQASPVKDWLLTGTHPQNYEMGVDRSIVHQGNASGYLKALTQEEPEQFATMMQQFKAQQFVGRRMRFTGFVKTIEVQDYCGLWMRVDNHAQDVLQFDNMSNRKISGDTVWNHYSIVLDVPENSAAISIGVLLMGMGQVWVDGFKFEEVDLSVPTTNIELESELLDGPSNLSFEE